ncbi:lantibiotic synthetase [Streptococcus pneumoniae]|nr:lantibiotic synthetase [Streptococcus pneumoniae]
MNNDEWVYQYPIGKFVERQGWKIHISSEYNSSHELLQDVAKICHEMRIPFKHLLLSIIIFRNNFMFIVSKWNLLYCKSYIKSISAAITGAILLISSFQMISQNILSQFQDDSDLELKVAFIVYVGAPILIVLANIISIAFLSSHQERIEIQQFEILGTSNYQMVKIKVGEAIFLTFVTSLIAFLLNIKIMALIYYSLEDILIDDMNLLGLILPNFIVSIILFILIFITKSSYFIFKNAKIIS